MAEKNYKPWGQTIREPPGQRVQCWSQERLNNPAMNVRRARQTRNTKVGFGCENFLVSNLTNFWEQRNSFHLSPDSASYSVFGGFGQTVGAREAGDVAQLIKSIYLAYMKPRFHVKQHVNWAWWYMPGILGPRG